MVSDRLVTSASYSGIACGHRAISFERQEISVDRPAATFGVHLATYVSGSWVTSFSDQGTSTPGTFRAIDLACEVVQVPPGLDLCHQENAVVSETSCGHLEIAVWDCRYRITCTIGENSKPYEWIYPVEHMTAHRKQSL